MIAKFYGVRGSYPVPGPDTNRYGGNTTCVSIYEIVDDKIVRVIIDMGNGAILAGKEILSNFFAQKEDLTIPVCFTHLHPDHTQGFPFFAPNFFPNCAMHLFGMKTLKKHIGSVLEQEMLPPTFPIEYKDLKSDRKHYEVHDGMVFYVEKTGRPVMQKTPSCVFEIKAMQAYAPSHPQQGAVYYRITSCITGKSVTCVWDLESHFGGDKRVIAFAKDTDVLIHDTQYTDEEYNNEKMVVQGFGHSTYSMAIDNAIQAGARTLICTHYNPSHSDTFLDTLASKLSSIDGIKIVFAKEQLAYEV